eukprot:9443560-Alexandrium_andersonii.AAC.1
MAVAAEERLSRPSNAAPRRANMRGAPRRPTEAKGPPPWQRPRDARWSSRRTVRGQPRRPTPTTQQA